MLGIQRSRDTIPKVIHQIAIALDDDAASARAST